ncbi:MAG: alginate lyase [Saprospiraceae bacterium]|nr:alginate lyase [Saprospiraceae bacterium]
MKNPFLLLAILLFTISCQQTNNQIYVEDSDQLTEAIANAKAGDNIVMANGIWNNVQLEISKVGTEDSPIVIEAETPGEVFIEGESFIKLGGDYITIKGLYFRNGFSPNEGVIQFRIDEEQLANNCKVTQCVIKDFNKLQRDDADSWVVFWGRNNALDHCYVAGKSNRGPTTRVLLRGNQSIWNHHQIVNNYFGPRPRKGGPSAETIQIGNSGTSMAPSNTLVQNNLFDRCNGEVEVISSKSNFNEFRNNVFFQSEGSLVTRHGNYCIIDGNYFIGDNSENIGGVRIINTGHWITNNYFYNLKGQAFRSPLAIMNGIPKSPLNRYNQVTDVVVAHNTWINCTSPWQFGVGTNISQSDVLPPSEIRSARAIRTILANNLIYNESPDSQPIVAHDKIDGVKFYSNYINNQAAEYEKIEGLDDNDFNIEKVDDHLYTVGALSNTEVYVGFDFESIQNDIFGNSRSENNQVGAISGPAPESLFNRSDYGPSWFDPTDEEPEANVLSTTPENFAKIVEEAEHGDIIELEGGPFNIDQSIPIDKMLTIRSKSDGAMPSINYGGQEETPLFQMQPGGHLYIKGIKISGVGNQYAFATMKENMSSLYNLTVEDSEITDFDYVLKAYKQSFSDEITFKGTKLLNCENGIELSEETNDRGDYNVEFLTIDDCEFKNINKNVIDYYRGGYDESTIGGNLLVSNSTFTNCGRSEENGILLNSRGIINVDISGNTFENNRVKLVALLWGAKNNTHSNNTIVNSGKLIVEENLKLTLMY